MPPGKWSGLNLAAQILYGGVLVWCEWFASNLSWRQLRQLVDDVPNSQLVELPMVLYCGMSPIMHGAFVLKTITWAILVQLT